MDLGLNFIIELANVKVDLNGKSILDNINLRLAEAEFVYLKGKSGSGKSSFIKALYGLHKLSGSKAKVVGHNLLTLEKNEIPDYRRKLGFIFQDFHLFNDWSIEENLLFVLNATDWDDQSAMDARVEESLNAVELDLASLNRPVFELSDGEKQKLAIARSILNHPKLIVADEATGKLDQDSSNEILQLLQRLSKERGSGIIFATHDNALTERFPARTWVCENGRIGV